MLHGQGVKGEDRVEVTANASRRALKCIPTPDSSSQRESTPCGWKCGQLVRICSGSLDRLVLGHLCTDRPQNTCIRIARARGRTIGHGRWAAEHGVHTWGTAAKQQHISHSLSAQAPTRQSVHYRCAREARGRRIGGHCSCLHVGVALPIPCALIIGHGVRIGLFRGEHARRLRPRRQNRALTISFFLRHQQAPTCGIHKR